MSRCFRQVRAGTATGAEPVAGAGLHRSRHRPNRWRLQPQSGISDQQLDVDEPNATTAVRAQRVGADGHAARCRAPPSAMLAFGMDAAARECNHRQRRDSAPLQRGECQAFTRAHFEPWCAAPRGADAASPRAVDAVRAPAVTNATNPPHLKATRALAPSSGADLIAPGHARLVDSDRAYAGLLSERRRDHDHEPPAIRQNTASCHARSVARRCGSFGVVIRVAGQAPRERFTRCA
jgi:hypothetical protein